MQINNKEIKKYCPLCNSQNINKKGNLKYSKKVSFSSNKIELTSLPELWKCQQCLSGFVQYTIDAETAKMLYTAGQAGARWATESFEQNKTLNVLEAMTSIFKNKGCVLDVGCNTGELLDFAHGFGCKTTGVEFSSASREILKNKGHDAYSNFEDLPCKYDVITAFDLVEHLYDLNVFMKSCRDKLADNGQLVILTGDINSLSATLSGVSWWYAQYPEHIIFPSKKFYREHTGLRINKWIPTYASKGYENSIHAIGWRIIKGMLRRMNYTGLPSLGPDHVLVVLSK